MQLAVSKVCVEGGRGGEGCQRPARRLLENTISGHLFRVYRLARSQRLYQIVRYNVVDN